MAKIIKLENKKNKEAKKDEAGNIKARETGSVLQYQQLIKENPLNQKAYNRLMILYRKLKDYKKELQLINIAIRSFEKFYATHKKKRTRSIQTISNKLSRSLGLVDKKGKTTFDHEPIAGWKKRKALLVKKMNS